MQTKVMLDLHSCRPRSPSETPVERKSVAVETKICSANLEGTSNEKFEARTLERLSGLSVVILSGNWKERSGT